MLPCVRPLSVLLGKRAWFSVQELWWWDRELKGPSSFPKFNDTLTSNAVLQYEAFGVGYYTKYPEGSKTFRKMTALTPRKEGMAGEHVPMGAPGTGMCAHHLHPSQGLLPTPPASRDICSGPRGEGTHTTLGALDAET